jgi:hypothetical protein
LILQFNYLKFKILSNFLFYYFSGLTAIIAGLQGYSINRLKKTWTSVSNDYVDEFQRLAEICSQNSSYSKMRDEMLKKTPPLIPPMCKILNINF